MNVMTKAALAATVALVGTAPSTAAVLAFSYAFPGAGNRLSGVVTGNVQADGNRFTITSLDSLAVNGAAVASDYRVTGYDYVVGEQAALSLDGSYLNLVLSRVSPSGFILDAAFQVGTPFAADVATFYPQFPNGVVAALQNLGGNGPGTQAYVRTSYSAQLVDGVPEPATWGMLILGFGAIGATMRRRSVSVRFA